MSNRTRVLILITALAACVLLLVCSAVAVGGYYLFKNSGPISANPFTTNPFSALTAPPSLNRIVFVGNDFNIYVADPANGAAVALTHDGGTDHAYNFPTWSPDDRRLAFVGYTFQSGSPTEGALYTISPSGENLTPVFKTSQNFPFYLYWSPDSQFISFLANKDSGTIELAIARTDKADSMQEIDTGSPFYWAWAPDSSQMFTHVGGTRADNDAARLALLAPKAQGTPHSLDAAPGQFQAPQWSRSGKLLYSTSDGADQAIAIGDISGKDAKKLVTYPGRASFALAPDSLLVAYILTDADTRLPHLGPLRVMDATGENIRLVSEDPALAFLWSPDSSRLAYLTVTVGNNQSNWNFRTLPPLASTQPEKFALPPDLAQGGQSQVQLHWHVWDRATNTSRIVASFVPTSSFLNVIPYFDQYANSSTFWSPDSRALVYTARDTETSGSIYIADAVGDTPARKIGEGSLAFWSW